MEVKYPMYFFKIEKVPKYFSLDFKVKNKILLFSKIWHHATSEFGIDFIITKEHNVPLFLTISSRLKK